MRILVTGGTGFIGSHLVEALVAGGHEVTCLVRDGRRLGWLATTTAHPVVGDLGNPGSLREWVEGADRIYHLAGVTKARTAREFRRVNTEGTENLLRGCLKARGGPSRLIHLSSLAAVGPRSQPIASTEDAAPRPVSAYGWSKLWGETSVLEARDRMHVTVLRPPVVYGPRDRGVWSFAHWVAHGLLPMPGGRPRHLSVCFVEDLVAALLAAGEGDIPSGEVFHVASQGDLTWEEVGDAFGEALGVRPTPLRIPVPLLLTVAAAAEAWTWATGRPGFLSRGKVREAAGHWVCNTTKAQRMLGVVPRVGLREGVERTVTWYREAGWL